MRKFLLFELEFNPFSAAGLHLWNTYSSDQKNAPPEAIKQREKGMGTDDYYFQKK